MAEKNYSGTSSFLFICVFKIACNIIYASVEDGFLANYSSSMRYTVPKNLPAKTTILDLSQNQISEIRFSDFRSLLKLQALILSHNLIKMLNFSVFQNNEDLEYLDLSHNNLQFLSGLPVTSLKHLDISYNDDINMTMCSDSGVMLKMEYLGLSARRIQKSTFCVLAHLELETLFLGLEELLQDHTRNFPVFNVKTLRISLPKKINFPILLDLDLNVTESLEISNIPVHQVKHLIIFLSKLNKNGKLLNLTLTNIHLDWGDILNIFTYVWRSPIKYLRIHEVTISKFDDEVFNDIDTSLKALTIEHTKVDTVDFNQTIVYRTFSEMNIPALTVSDSSMLYMYCPLKSSRFTYLNFSSNILTDTVFQSCNNLPLLETLIVQRNYLKDLTKVSLMTNSMKSLKYLDASHNFLEYEGENKCHWAQNMMELNLSFNKLSESVFRCLPVNIQILDLQENHVSRIPKEMIKLYSLEELNLAFNKLTTLPGCGTFSNLRLLNIENNSVLSQSSEFFESCQRIRRLKGGNNPFRCSCGIRQFITLGKEGPVELIGWPDSYMCEKPEYVRGTLLENFHVSELVCNVSLFVVVVLIVTVVLGIAVSILCIRFDIPWYLKMIWQWTQVKRRSWKSQPEVQLNTLQFHAFVSYSEHDSDWVKNVLIPNLEKEDGSIRICQHERNFVAGKSIVENIIDCIEKSYKSIFVLSPNFVQSEWCHYELYFAHHKVFSEDVCGLILLLLEPIPSYMIPSRYHKLKALMAKRTYLEWPKEKSKHGLFWANLRAAIQIRLPNNVEMEELQIT